MLTEALNEAAELIIGSGHETSSAGAAGAIFPDITPPTLNLPNPKTVPSALRLSSTNQLACEQDHSKAQRLEADNEPEEHGGGSLQGVLGT